jgi:hypothetical protein
VNGFVLIDISDDEEEEEEDHHHHHQENSVSEISDGKT